MGPTRRRPPKRLFQRPPLDEDSTLIWHLDRIGQALDNVHKTLSDVADLLARKELQS